MSEIEPILSDSSKRFTTYPIEYPDLWDLYKKAEASFWTAGEIDFSSDIDDWEKLAEPEKNFILHILAFFAGSDGVVLENLLGNFMTEVKISEARSFYALQGAIESIHGEVYSLLIDTYCKDPDTKNKLFTAIESIPCVAKKTNWALKWMDPKTKTFSHRLIAFAVVEGIFFSGSFCAIFWFKTRNLLNKTLGTSNELIARDESMHTEFAIALYSHLEYTKLSEEELHCIVSEAVEIECEFINESISCDLIGMNTGLMKHYIQFVADRLLEQLGVNRLYKTGNPFPFMDTIGLEGKTNFFEKRVTEYRKASSGNLAACDELEFSDDF